MITMEHVMFPTLKHHPASRKMAQIRNKCGNLTVDGDTSGYYFYIITCSVHDSCLDTIVCLFLDIRMTAKAHLQNIETRKKYNFI